MKVDVYADLVCPWCFIGTERLERVLESPDMPPAVTVAHHPMMLRPDAPPEGLDLHAELRAKFGATLEPLFARAEAAARESGLVLDLARRSRSYPTVRAHTLLRHAGARQRALARALYRAYFLDGRDISDAGVLVELAAQHGFSAADASRLIEDPAELARTRLDSDETRRRGITSVPVFVFETGEVVSGAQPEAILRAALVRAASGARP